MKEYENVPARAEDHPVTLAASRCEELGVGPDWEAEWVALPLEIRRATLDALSVEQRLALLDLGAALDNE